MGALMGTSSTESSNYANDNHSNQLNPNNFRYQGSESNKSSNDYARDNHSNQLNPNNSRYQGKKS